MAGNSGWSFDDLLPHFRAAESDRLGGPIHGAGGPVPVHRVPPNEMTELDRQFAAAETRLGFAWVEDLNGAAEQRPGIGPRPQNVDHGVRMNGAFTYLSAARRRPNLTILADTLVDRVVVEGRRAVGIQTSPGIVHRAEEIVLSAGAYASPAILLRSGIGPADQLADLGIRVVAELDGVGENLLDHPLVLDGLGSYRMAKSVEPSGSAPPFLPLMLLARSPARHLEIDVGVMLGQAFNDETLAWDAFPLVCLLSARSAGRVRLTAANAEATLDIDHAHLGQEADLSALCEGVELAFALLESPDLATILEAVPGSRDAPARPADLRTWLRNDVGTMFHPAGTCRMGADGDSGRVVDGAGRVDGLDSLRVVDASIFPSLPRATIHFPIVAAAEKLAGAIGGPG